MTDPEKEVTTDQELLEGATAEEVELPKVPEDLKPGIYQGLTYDEYAVLPAINFSSLRRFSLTAAHARYFIEHPPKETKALRFGHLMHTVILEPQKLDENFLIAPKVDRRTTVGKRAWAEFERLAKGRTIVNDDEMRICQNIRKNIAEHPTGRELLYAQDGANELTLVWLDAVTGLLCKSRLDRFGALNAQGAIGDVKSTGKPASLRNWQRSCFEYGYFEQAAMYREGAQTLFPLPEGYDRSFIWVVVESNEPNLVRLFEAEYDAMQHGYQEFRKHLDAYAECVRSGEYPGWEEGIETTGLPAWAQKTFDSQL
jgi:exodeoxyribonuclease VIII